MSLIYRMGCRAGQYDAGGDALGGFAALGDGGLCLSGAARHPTMATTRAMDTMNMIRPKAATNAQFQDHTAATLNRVEVISAVPTEVPTR